ncbi:DUF805 domain-containing protein [Agarivorans sp. QJM3NY_33]|uniref:DUF805 domain-containing protein n=1 Tax=Agarivorans sp. QJM3NY_33 TaxID=3421432 RepID=UPI003D7E53C2
MKWYWQAWKYALVFSGRSSREAFWMFFAVNLLVGLSVLILELTGVTTAWVDIVYSLSCFLPMLALTVRRLHDTGRSGWYLLLMVIPLVGPLLLLFLLAQPGLPGRHAFDQFPLQGSHL